MPQRTMHFAPSLRTTATKRRNMRRCYWNGYDARTQHSTDTSRSIFLPPHRYPNVLSSWKKDQQEDDDGMAEAHRGSTFRKGLEGDRRHRFRNVQTNGSRPANSGLGWTAWMESRGHSARYLQAGT